MSQLAMRIESAVDASPKALSHKQLILQHMQKGRKITALEALSLFGCFRLGARIWDLRHDGYNVQQKLIDVNGKTVAQYWLEPTCPGDTEGKFFLR